MAFTIATARELVRDSAVTSSSSTVWTDKRIDQAIMMVMDWANTRYKILTSTGTASTTNLATSDGSWLSSVVTLTTGTAHGMLVGDMINVSGVSPTGYNGQYVVVSVPSSTTLTYALGTDPGSYTTPHGTVSLINLPLTGISSPLNRRRFIRARTGMKKPLDRINWNSMIEWHESDTGQGEPLRIAFNTTSTERPLLHPAPDSTGYTFVITYLDLPTSWAVGSTSGGVTGGTFNIEDDLLRPMLYWGAAALMQHNTRDGRKVTVDPKWATMVEHLNNILHDTRDLGIDQMIPDD